MAQSRTRKPGNNENKGTAATATCSNMGES